jgi:hypothetical protein
MHKTVFEKNVLVRERIYIGRGIPLIPVAAQMVRPQRINAYQNNIWSSVSINLNSKTNAQIQTQQT